MDVHIREIRESDSAGFAGMLIEFSRKTPYMLLTEEESIEAAKTQLQRTRQILSAPNQQVIVAECDGILAGFVGLTQGLFAKNRHCCTLMIGVKSEYQRQGVAGRLMEQALSWAEDKTITRIELGVMEDNRAAIKLYTRFGFKQEGVKRNSLQTDGAYVNELLMARIVE